MKRACVLLLVLMLILTGCTGKEKTNNVSVKDVSCPYEISHKKDVVEITLQDGQQRGILWNVKAIPEDVCDVTQANGEKEYTSRYSVSGREMGAAQLTFTAQQENENVVFVLTLVVNVDGEGKTTVSSYQHREIADISVDAEGLNYTWNVDTDGTLNFSFTNDEDNWSVSVGEEGAFTLLNMMSTPSGCAFSAQAKTAGRSVVMLVGEETKREIQVVIRADDNGNVEVMSVQEQ